jgi:hypothetical protein
VKKRMGNHARLLFRQPVCAREGFEGDTMAISKFTGYEEQGMEVVTDKLKN